MTRILLRALVGVCRAVAHLAAAVLFAFWYAGERLWRRG